MSSPAPQQGRGCSQPGKDVTKDAPGSGEMLTPLGTRKQWPRPPSTLEWERSSAMISALSPTSSAMAVVFPPGTNERQRHQEAALPDLANTHHTLIADADQGASNGCSPGAAHISRILEPGFGARTAAATALGRFCSIAFPESSPV